MLYVGQPVVNDKTNSGFISAISDASMRTFLIGSGSMKPIKQSIEVTFSNRIVGDVDEHTANRWAERAMQLHKQPATPEQIAAMRAKIDLEEQAARQARESAIRHHSHAQELFRDEVSQKIPAWAKAVIIAEHDINRSDIQTDYFGHCTDRILILAWSKHTRDLFSEMRKAADKTPETAHLGSGKGVFIPRVILGADIYGSGERYWKGTYSHWHYELQRDANGMLYTFGTKPEAEGFIAEKGKPDSKRFDGVVVPFEWCIEESKIEHREKYSMGSGYYLKYGSSDSTGWKVRKQKLYKGPDSVPMGEWRL